MTLSVRQQLQRVRTLKKRMHAARTLVFVKEEGEELTDSERATVRKDDTVIIREIPRGYLGDI